MRRLLTVLGLNAALLSCADELAFTQEEHELLAGHTLAAAPPADPSNRYGDDPAVASLGKRFFFDRRFSGALMAPNDGVTNGSLGAAGSTGKVSCADCHHDGGAIDLRSRPSATSLGARYMPRNSPTVINHAFADAHGGWNFWDGRKDSMWSLPLAAVEGAAVYNSTRLHLVHVIHDFYKAEYEALFGPLPDLTDTVRFPPTGKPGDAAFDGMAAADKALVNRIYVNYGKSIAAYERRLVSSNFGPSAFDRMLAGDYAAMSAAAIRGAKLFIGKAACNECHLGSTFTDYKFHNIGAPQVGDRVPTIDLGRAGGIMALKNDAFNRAGMYSDQIDDSHLLGLELTPALEGAFKTPTLRNVAKTAPYMHDGAFATLRDVVDFYNRGGGTGNYSGSREVTIQPLLLDDGEINDLVEFLRSLNDGDPLPNADFPEGLLAPPQ